MRKIQYLHCNHLMKTNHYDDAFALIQELDIDPVRALAQFFPDFLPGNMKKHIESSPSPRVITANQFTFFTSSSTPVSNSNANGEYSFLLLPDEKAPDFDKEENERATQSLIRFLTDKRTQYIRIKKQRKVSVADPHLYSPKSEKRFLKSETNSPVLDGSTEKSTSPELFNLAISGSQQSLAATNDELDETLTIIDSALIKAYLITNDALIGPLLRVSNRCNVEETEALLIQHKKWNELLDLYFGKSLHRKALILMAKHIKTSNHPLSGIAHTLKYLKKLGTEHLELIFEFASTPLQVDPNESLSVRLQILCDKLNLTLCLDIYR